MIPQKIMAFLANNIISVLSITILTGATVSTSIMGVAKVAGNFSTAKLQVPVQATADSNSSSSSSSVPASPTPSPVKKYRVVLPTVSVNSSLIQSSTTGQSTAAGNRCIITLFGNQYDVTTLQDTHSGGNVFICGADQTSLYQSQHGSNLSRMAPYLVTANNPTGSGSQVIPGQSKTVGAGNSKEKEDRGRNQDQKEEDEVDRE